MNKAIRIISSMRNAFKQDFSDCSDLFFRFIFQKGFRNRSGSFREVESGTPISWFSVDREFLHEVVQGGSQVQRKNLLPRGDHGKLGTVTNGVRLGDSDVAGRPPVAVDGASPQGIGPNLMPFVTVPNFLHADSTTSPIRFSTANTGGPQAVQPGKIRPGEILFDICRIH